MKRKSGICRMIPRCHPVPFGETHRIFYALLLLCILSVMLTPLVHAATSACGNPVNDQDCERLEKTYIDTPCSQCIAQYGVDACIDSPACERSEQCFALCTDCISSDSALVRKYNLDCRACGCAGAESLPPAEDGGWIVVVGALGILAVAGIGAAVVLKGRKPTEKGSKEKKERKEPVTYILQLSADHLSVAADRPASLTVTVWKKEGQKPPVAVPDALVSVIAPQGSGLSVNPPQGNSPLRSGISLAGEAGASPVVLGISATAGGTTKRANVTVEISDNTRIEFE